MSQSTSNSTTFEHDFAEVNGVRLHYAHAGSGPVMVFLHGFPQCWYMWRHQVTEFGIDHLVVAPDQRGYNLSSKPEGVTSYGIRPTVEDIRALVKELGHDRFVLVGHDWGGGAGWYFAMRYPEMLDALVVLVSAHPALFERELRESPVQEEASQYLLLVRSPEAEALAGADDFGALRAALDFPFFTDRDIETYHAAWSRPGALRGMLSWYPAEMLGPRAEDGTPAHGDFAYDIKDQRVEVPTLLIYPEADPYILPGCHIGLEDLVGDLTVQRVPGASHWVAEEHPTLVNGFIRQFLAAHDLAAVAGGSV